MKKYILLCTVFALILTGCGKIETANEEDESKSESLSTISDTDDDTSSENNSYNVLAAVSSVNLLGEKLSGRISDAEGLYNFVKTAQDKSEIINDAEDNCLVTVGFKVNDEEFILSCCSDNVFAWAKKTDRKQSEVTFFKPDSETAIQLRDMMLAYSALRYVFEDTTYSVVPEHTETDSIARISEERSSVYDETRYYYIDDRTTRIFNIQTDGEAVYYLQETSVKTDATIDYEPYYQETDFYEYFSNGRDKAFYRPESYDVFYPADEFEGDIQPVPLAEETAEKEQYLYSFSVKTDTDELTVEAWQGDGTTDYFLVQDGAIKAMWNYREGTGMTLMHAFRTDEVQNGDIDEMISHAETHTADTDEDQTVSPSGNDEWIKYDTEKYGLFDLSGGVTVGEEVEPTGVVEEWREYISSEANPFTLELRWAGSGRNEYEICTFDGSNYYYRNDMEIHDDPDNLGGEEWRVDGRFFQSIYSTDDYENREITEWPLDEYAKVPIDLLFENEKRGDEYVGNCVRAYEVTIDNENYICEEWSLMLGRLWKVYIKGGNIVAWEGDFYNEPTVNTVIRLEKSADTDLIRIPEGAKKHVAND